jgi:hypothetical protein
MNPERKEFLNLLSLPGRISATEAAWKLGFETDHITILTSAGLLKPLGHPPPGAMKFFAAVEIEQKKNDAKWLNKASEVVRLKWKDKNERAAKSRALKGSVSATNGNNSHDRHS